MVDRGHELGIRLLQPAQPERATTIASNEQQRRQRSRSSSGTPTRCSRLRIRQPSGVGRSGRQREAAGRDVGRDECAAASREPRAGGRRFERRTPLLDVPFERVVQRRLFADLAHGAAAPVHVVRGGRHAVRLHPRDEIRVSAVNPSQHEKIARRPVAARASRALRGTRPHRRRRRRGTRDRADSVRGRHAVDADVADRLVVDDAAAVRRAASSNCANGISALSGFDAARRVVHRREQPAKLGFALRDRPAPGP